MVGELRPTTDSHIAFEVWLPLDTWNGKFAGVGNGGWAGIISYPALAEQLRRGYATVSTNTGHVAELGFDMAKFAFGHPERLADFGWRSVHEMTEKGKAITAAHYGRAARYAFWIGCSTGGKQGLTEAQRFPSDYDGIVAVAPANNWARLMAGDVAPQSHVARDPANVLSPAQGRLLHRAVLKACDARDGVVDSLIENPAKCVFDPASVQCAAGAPADSTCLTAPQIETARRVYAGAKDPSGRVIYPGLAPGSEPFWGALINPARPFPIPQSYYRWIVLGDSTWDWKSLDLSTPAGYAVQREAEAKYDPVLAAVNPNLRDFRAHGGKLIQLHGWNDQLISPRTASTITNLSSRSRRAPRAIVPRPRATWTISSGFSWCRECCTAAAALVRRRLTPRPRSNRGWNGVSPPIRFRRRGSSPASPSVRDRFVRIPRLQRTKGPAISTAPKTFLAERRDRGVTRQVARERSQGRRFGSRSVNVDPRPTVLSTVRSPPIARARSRLIARPSPVPSVARE